MKVFWYVYGLVLLIYLYLIFIEGMDFLSYNLSLYSLLGLFAYTFEKSNNKEKRKVKIEEF